jgi:hypothetical protein
MVAMRTGSGWMLAIATSVDWDGVVNVVELYGGHAAPVITTFIITEAHHQASARRLFEAGKCDFCSEDEIRDAIKKGLA